MDKFAPNEFTPLGVREGRVAHNGPYEGVPDHLLRSLLDWVSDVFYHEWQSGARSHAIFEFDLLKRAERRVRFVSDIDPNWGSASDLLDELREFLAKNREDLLSLIDFVLWDGAPRADAQTLQVVLDEGGSVYRVAATSGRSRLERRVEAHIDRLAREEMNRGGVASELLAAAWSATYGRDPNPSHGYRSAVRAVEAASVVVVLPNDSGATLGRVIGHLAATRDQWAFALPHRRDGAPGVQTLVDAMGALWTSQYDRHVRRGAPLHVSQREADAGLPLAAVLVHWFQTGALHRET